MRFGGTFGLKVALFCFPFHQLPTFYYTHLFTKSPSEKQSDSPACLHDLMMMKDELQSPVT